MSELPRMVAVSSAAAVTAASAESAASAEAAAAVSSATARPAPVSSSGVATGLWHQPRLSLWCDGSNAGDAAAAERFPLLHEGCGLVAEDTDGRHGVRTVAVFCFRRDAGSQ